MEKRKLLCYMDYIGFIWAQGKENGNYYIIWIILGLYKKQKRLYRDHIVVIRDNIGIVKEA